MGQVFESPIKSAKEAENEKNSERNTGVKLNVKRKSFNDHKKNENKRSKKKKAAGKLSDLLNWRKGSYYHRMKSLHEQWVGFAREGR